MCLMQITWLKKTTYCNQLLESHNDALAIHDVCLKSEHPAWGNGIQAPGSGEWGNLAQSAAYVLG